MGENSGTSGTKEINKNYGNENEGKIINLVAEGINETTSTISKKNKALL